MVYALTLPTTKSKAVAQGVLPFAAALASSCPPGQGHLRLGSPPVVCG